jgi:hypothetical protein
LLIEAGRPQNVFAGLDTFSVHTRSVADAVIKMEKRVVALMIKFGAILKECILKSMVG